MDWVVDTRAEIEKIWQADLKRLGADLVRTRFAARMPVTELVLYPDAAQRLRLTADGERWRCVLVSCPPGTYRVVPCATLNQVV
jgi:hypothetical protein